MDNLIWVELFVGFIIWWTAVTILNKAGVLKRFNITAYGPLIIWKTYRGQKFLDWLASPAKFWKALVTVCLPLVMLSMVLMLLMVLLTSIIMIFSTPAPSQVNAPQNILAIPGVNEFIPFLWGWLALIVGMVVHEFGHAIMAKAEKIKVKSLGLLLIPVPLGAFAEIDEEEMFGTKTEGGTAEILGPMDTKAAGTGNRKASSMALVRILGAGVISNILIAVIAFALLFGPVLGAVAATNSEMVVVNVAPGSPAALAGIHKNMIIKSVDGTNVTTPDQFNSYLKSKQGSSVTIGGIAGDKPSSYTVNVGDTQGIYILGVISGQPAEKAGLGPNYRLLSINGTPVNSYADYSTYMKNTTPGQLLNLGLIDNKGNPVERPITLGTGPEPKGYMGFTGSDLSDNSIGLMVGNFNAENHLSWLRGLPAPTGDTLGQKALSMISGFFIIWILPVWEVTGGLMGFGVFQSDLAGLYHPVGWAQPLGSGILYIALALFWIGWLNINLAIFNCLPMIPLDGGHIFREVTRKGLGYIIKDQNRVDQISKTVVNIFSVVLISSLVFVMVAPYIVHGL
ncbi:site-2 protease family protein [Methanocella sp. MCL-LM]|uniref:site-2 protease family protein n=1 Tax=Methanocella sp. MCL-LM TaxID=3412035 RepID=UPI003C72AE4D